MSLTLSAYKLGRRIKNALRDRSDRSASPSAHALCHRPSSADFLLSKSPAVVSRRSLLALPKVRAWLGRRHQRLFAKLLVRCSSLDFPRASSGQEIENAPVTLSQVNANNMNYEARASYFNVLPVSLMTVNKELGNWWGTGGVPSAFSMASL